MTQKGEQQRQMLTPVIEDDGVKVRARGLVTI